MRVTPELTVLDTVYICTRAGGQNIPAITFNGINYITVWYDPGLSEGIVAARVTPQGAVLDSGISLGPGDDDPDIASGDGNSVAVWSRDYDGVYGRCLDQQAQPLDTMFRIGAITASGTSPRIASDGQNYMAVWADFGPTGDLDVFGRLVTGQGQMPADVFPVAQGAAVQKDPNLCFDGNKYITVWLEDGSRIIGQFIGTDGKLIGGPFLVSDTTSCERQYPALGVVTNNYLAVWAEYHGGFDIYAAMGDLIGVAESGSDRMGMISVVPNPFRTSTQICIGHRAPLRGSGASLQDFQTEGIELKIYDTVGRLVNSFALKSVTNLGGPYTLRWGQSVPPGVYFLRDEDGCLNKIIKLK